MPGAAETYAFDNTRAVQRERLHALEALLDPGTIRHLETLGVQPGSRCLEVGAGAGSIAAWLCERVAPDGRVVATDLDLTLLAELSYPNLETRRHDVLADELPEATYDFVHARLLLAWLRDPGTALRRLTNSLRPGGWLLAEEMDFVSVEPDPGVDPESAGCFVRVVNAHNAALTAQHTFEPTYGRRLVGALADTGLVGIGCEGRASMWRGGEPGGTVWRLTLTQLREPMLETGLATAADIDAAVELCADSRFSFLSQVTMAAWGRRPLTR